MPDSKVLFKASFGDITTFFKKNEFTFKIIQISFLDYCKITKRNKISIYFTTPSNSSSQSTYSFQPFKTSGKFH